MVCCPDTLAPNVRVRACGPRVKRTPEENMHLRVEKEARVVGGSA